MAAPQGGLWVFTPTAPFSIGDAIGFPQDHIDFAIENGMDALALTDHGNMNGYSHQYFYAKKLENKGVNFKAIPGLEAYFVDSLSKWEELYRKQQHYKQLQKFAKKGNEDAIRELERLGDPFASTKSEMDSVASSENDGGTVVENEEESKSNKYNDPIKQRNHLVLLPKNSEGLRSLFKIVSKSYTEGFYFYPRVDLEMLKKYANGNIIALTACIAGLPARKVFDHQIGSDWEKWAPNQDNFELIQKELKELAEKFKWALGDENFYFEIQFNRLSCVRGSTLIETNKGVLQIREVIQRMKKGESDFTVKSYNELEHCPEFKQIVWGDLTRKNAKTLKVNTKNGCSVVVTPDHKIFTNLGWMEAAELAHHSSVKILSKKENLEFSEVVSLEWMSDSEDVYDIEVEGNHNFFANELLVHNCQHLVNQHLIESSKRTNTPLVATVDAHYSHPEHWRQREIYKMMAWASRGMEMDKDKIPKKIDELKCELYPKNAEQVWESYKSYTKDMGWDFYDDDVVCDAIERSYTIAHEQIENPTPDTSVKLPSIARLVKKDELEELYESLGEGVDEDRVAFSQLKRLTIDGIKARGLADRQEYIERLKHELRVVKHLKFSKYFLTYAKIMEIVSKHMLIGNARGCFLPDSCVVMSDGSKKKIQNIKIGDEVLDAFGNKQNVENCFEYEVEEECVKLEFDDGRVIQCTKDHEILTKNRGWVEAQHLTEEDEIADVMPIVFEKSIIQNRKLTYQQKQ